MRRETIKLADGVTYWSDDGWTTIWRLWGGPSAAGSIPQRVTDKAEADNVRHLAILAPGRDGYESSSRGS